MTNQKSCVVCKSVVALLVIGAVNWGLIGAFQFDLVARILGEMSLVSRIVYGLVGLAGVVKIISFFKPCPCCCKSTGTP